VATSLISCALFYQPAQAISIDGTIGFWGSGSVTTGATTTVNFTNPELTIWGNGAYSGVPSGTQVTFQSINYIGTGESATLTPAPVTPLWTFTVGGLTYWFELTSLSSANITSGSLALAGLGTAYITGFTPTEGNFAISGTGPNLTLQFVSASTTANGVAVPDGGLTVTLLGFALIGLGALHKIPRGALKTA
jgi:hypothetical protein